MKKKQFWLLCFCLKMFHHPIYNKRQEIGKDVGGPSKPNHELSSLSSTNTAANCKYTFHVQSFNLLWKQVITYSCTTSIYYDSYKLHLVGYFCCFCVLIIPALAALQDIFSWMWYDYTWGHFAEVWWGCIWCSWHGICWVPTHECMQ